VTQREILGRLIAAAESAEPFERDQILHDLIEDVRASTGRPRRSGCTCPVCGLRFDFPGLRDRHLLAVHPEERAA
jgi:hypothetical protein